MSINCNSSQHSLTPCKFVLFWLFLWTSYNIYLPGSVISFEQNKFINTCSFFSIFTEIAILPYYIVMPHLLGAAVPLCAMASSSSMSLLCPDKSNLSYPSLGLPGGEGGGGVCPWMAEWLTRPPHLHSVIGVLLLTYLETMSERKSYPVLRTWCGPGGEAEGQPGWSKAFKGQGDGLARDLFGSSFLGLNSFLCLFAHGLFRTLKITEVLACSTRKTAGKGRRRWEETRKQTGKQEKRERRKDSRMQRLPMVPWAIQNDPKTQH